MPKADGAVLEEDLPQVECPLIAARLADGHRGFRNRFCIFLQPLRLPRKNCGRESCGHRRDKIDKIYTGY